jgi:hypothetical protein
VQADLCTLRADYLVAEGDLRPKGFGFAPKDCKVRRARLRNRIRSRFFNVFNAVFLSGREFFMFER